MSTRSVIEDASRKKGRTPIVLESAGSYLSIHLLLLRITYFVCSFLGIRGYGRITTLLAKLFGNQEAYWILKVHGHSRYKVLLSDPYWNLLMVSGRGW
jgi:hypothetical protein